MQPPYEIKPWSYSSMNTFKTCPHRYFREKIKKDIPRDPDTEAIIYGVELHKVMEDYVGSGGMIQIPEKFSIAKPWAERLLNLPGDKFVERKMGISRDGGVFTACEYDAPNVWFRGIADLVVVNPADKTAYIVDYKTGKSAKYADPTQLELMAACVFLLYPKIERIKAMLLFIVCKQVVKVEYEVGSKFKVFEKLDEVLHRRTKAYETGVFNKNPNGLCRAYCPVVDCGHNGRN